MRLVPMVVTELMISKSYVICTRCGGKMITRLFPEGKENSCLICGFISYGENYTPMDIPVAPPRGRGKKMKKVS